MDNLTDQISPTQRFTDRVDSYVKYRPAYPSGAIRFFREKLGLKTAHSVADIGSGTGISTELFLKNGNTVYAVEPNQAMRQAAEAALDYYLGFHSRIGTAEATGLTSKSVDFIVAAQAFHWFKPQPTQTEFRRILKPGGYVALMWNDRKTTGNPFATGYAALTLKFGTETRHKTFLDAELRDFLGDYQTEVIDNFHELDFPGVLGLVTSSSYMPNVDHPRYPQMREELRALFDANAVNGRIKMEYDTRIFHARWK